MIRKLFMPSGTKANKMANARVKYLINDYLRGGIPPFLGSRGDNNTHTARKIAVSEVLTVLNPKGWLGVMEFDGNEGEICIRGAVYHFNCRFVTIYRDAVDYLVMVSKIEVRRVQ